MVISPQNPEFNFYELPEVQGMAIGATPQANSPATTPATSNIVQTGGGSVINGGTLESPNFRPGVSGYRLDSNGNLEANDGNFRGDITGASGTFTGTITATAGAIGGWSISATAIYKDGATDALSAGMAPADYPFYAGKKYADRATAPFKVAPSGQLTASDIVATGTINAQAGYLASGVYIDTVNGLLCESGGINVGTSGHIRGGQTDYNTGAGFFLGYSGGAYKFSVGNPAGKYINWTGTDFVVNGFVISSKGAFGGDGSDGALSISSGTTTLDVGATSVYIKNYTSISITGTTGKLAFSNPASGGTVIIIKSQGAVVLTSTVTGADASTLGCIDVSNMGAAGGATQSGSGNGNNGTDSNIFIIKTNKGLASAGGGAGGVAGVLHSFNLAQFSAQQTRYQTMFCGAGGASGGAGIGSTGGAGGRGGGILAVECAGDLNFPATAGLYGRGTIGSDSGGVAGGGGGGGGGGSIYVLYNSATSAAGAITVTGGTGGAGDGFAGGGGGGSRGAGVAGQSQAGGGDGGAGGVGLAGIFLNNELT